MTARRTAARRDNNEPDIILALRARGCSVQQISDKGVPDLLVGLIAHDGTPVNLLMEVKSDKGHLTDDQEIFFKDWMGQRCVVRSVKEALAVVDMVSIPITDTVYKVLDRGYVTVLGQMGTEGAIVDAARTSHQSMGSPDTDKQLIHNLLAWGHTSPLEHATLHFEVKAPMMVWWQWVRHRHASYTLQSGRYTQLHEFYYPDRCDEWDEANYVSFIDIATTMYDLALEAGVPKELARIFLPISVYYTGRITMNLRSLLNFVGLRTDDSAQYEIRQYAIVVDNILHERFPTIMGAYRGAESD
jgi:thymidylate synthase (FAD)